MSRLVLALLVAFGLAAPVIATESVASAQVWKLKKPKAGTAAKTTKKTRSARPTVKKKKSRAKPRKVQLVPDDNEQNEADTGRDNDVATRPREDEERIEFKVEEVFD